jgi:hypothetical protein
LIYGKNEQKKQKKDEQKQKNKVGKTIQWTKDTKKIWTEAINQSRTDNTMNKRYQKDMIRNHKSKKNRQYNGQKIPTEMIRSRK